MWQPLRYRITDATLGPTAINGPRTRDHIYNKAKPDSTIRYVNAQITKEKRIYNLL
jgi:hypothetical protein